MMAGPRASKASVQKLRVQFGLDKPYPEQYVNYVKGVLHLDFGTSFASRRPVREDLKQKLPATIELGLYAWVLATIVGIPLGVASAVKRDSWIDSISRFISISGLALPVFWLAIMFQFAFFGKLGWLPDGQRLDIKDTPPPSVTTLYSIDALLSGNLPLFWKVL